MQHGKALIFSAPSGSGKTTIVQHLVHSRKDLEFSISATTRQPRPGEVDGRDYYFLTEEDFLTRSKENAFLEWEEVYEGLYYGTLQSELDRIWQLGKHAVFDVDVVGGVSLKKALGDSALGVFVRVNDVLCLEERLKSRGTESAATLKMRLEKMHEELKYESDFDITLVNDQLDDALRNAEEIIGRFLD